MSLGLIPVYKLHRLEIKHSRYQPHFRPITGKLIAHYNGAVLACNVIGAEVICNVTTPEGSFKLISEQEEPGGKSWNEIWQYVLTRAVVVMRQTAQNQMEEFAVGGRCVRH